MTFKWTKAVVIESGQTSVVAPELSMSMRSLNGQAEVLPLTVESEPFKVSSPTTARDEELAQCDILQEAEKLCTSLDAELRIEQQEDSRNVVVSFSIDVGA